MDTQVVNINRSPYDVYCGRSGKGQDGYFGNPFNCTNRWRNIVNFWYYFNNRLKDPKFYKRVQGLRGKRLGCFCKPKDCHVDVIAAYLNGRPITAEYLYHRYRHVLSPKENERLIKHMKNERVL